MTTAHNDVAVKSGTTVRKMVNRIVRQYDDATNDERLAGADWYRVAFEASSDLASRYGVTVEQAAGVISALSPRMPWKRNVAVAKQLLATGTAGCLSANVRKANAILATDDIYSVLVAHKTNSFARNILGDTQAVTIDTWAARIVLGIWDTDLVRARTGMYQAMAHSYRLAAKRRDVTPAVMQATTWVAVRNNVQAITK